MGRVPPPAQLSALVEAQHVTKAEPRRHLLLKNTYDVELSRDGGRWVIDHMVIRNVWHDGDPAVLFGAVTDVVTDPPESHVSAAAPTWMTARGDRVTGLWR